MSSNLQLPYPKENNLDLLRLLAAIQVVIVHLLQHLQGWTWESSNLIRALGWIPGVPIFFFLSGFLITMSYERSTNFKSFARSRFLRLFPGLWVCILVSILLAYMAGYFVQHPVGFGKLVPWFAAQGTILQFYNPDFLRDYGTGVMNGSLWMISVEVQFYILMPVLAILFKKRWPLLILFVISLVTNIAMNFFDLGETLFGKLIGVSFLPWIYMFICGQLAYKSWPKISSFVRRNAFGFFLIYAAITCVTVLLEEFYGWKFGGNRILPPNFIVLSALILSLSLRAPSLSRKILRGNDISYGVYIYHLPLINFFVYTAVLSSMGTSIAVFVLTFVCALMSWIGIERIMLRKKTSTIHAR